MNDVVVDNGRRLLGQTLNVTITSVLQTQAGRMIFAKADENSIQDPRDRVDNRDFDRRPDHRRGNRNGGNFQNGQNGGSPSSEGYPKR